MKLTKDNIIAIACPHIPFAKKGYREFCKDTQIKYGCGTVVLLGDIVDNHGVNYHEHDPDLWSPGDEMKIADRELAGWFKAFPDVYITWGNHDRLPDRKRKSVGLPKRCFRSFREMWNLPKGWKDGPEVEIFNIMFRHQGKLGVAGSVNTALALRQSAVVGHSHSMANVMWSANQRDRIFGMSCGCGADWKSMAFAYGTNMFQKHMIACGVILDRGRLPFIVPMDIR